MTLRCLEAAWPVNWHMVHAIVIDNDYSYCAIYPHSICHWRHELWLRADC